MSDNDKIMFAKKQRTILYAALLTYAAPIYAADEQLALEEVLVTAQKQTQNLQETPVTVNVISSQAFNDVASFDLADVDRMTAGVDISGDSFNIDFQVRGVGTNLDAGTPPRVTIYKDGVFVNQQRALFLSQFDLERFELLRGPQGTLYGKASPAGSLIIYTKDPSMDRNDGYLQTSFFSRDGSNTQFGISQPLIKDKLSLRLAGSFDKNSNADIHNEPLDDDAISRTSAGRATLKWLVSEKLDMRASYNYTENSGDFYTITEQNGYEADDRRAFGDAGGEIRVRDQHAIGQMNYALTDNITATLVTMYQELFTYRFFDSDRSAGPATATSTASTQDVRSNIGKVINSEFRIASTGNEMWDWITGVYYSTSDAKTPVVASTDFVTMGAPGNNTFFIVATNSGEDYGIFHHSGFQLTDSDKLTIGVRYNDTRVNARSTTRSVTNIPAFGPFGFSDVSGEGIPLENEKRSFTEVTGTLKWQHNFGENHTGYISYDKGWRPASATVDAAGTVPDELILHDDEPSTNYEIGMKGTYWNDRARYLMAIYYQTYEDFQFQADNIPVDVAGPTPGSPPDGTAETNFNAVVNAEEALTRGVELETTVLLQENWTFFGSVSYNDTTFVDYKNAPCDRGSSVPTGGYNTCDFSDQQASDAPHWSAVISSEYSVPMESWSAEWYLRGLVKYESERYNRGSDSYLEQATITDLFTGIRSNNGNWDVMLWVKNLENETVVQGLDFAPNGNSALIVNNPRTYGMTATWRFGEG